MWAMKLALVATSLVALALAAGCAASSSDDQAPASSDQDLTGTLGLGTYTIASRPWFADGYATRITLSSGKKFEAEVYANGETTLVAGSYTILPARPNNPDSPVQSDKPTLYMTPDNNDGPLTFEFDKLSNGEVKFYYHVRTESFTMKLDPSYQPPHTDSKTIECTGNQVDATITLDQAQGRRGTLKLKRKAGADDNDPPSASVSITKVAGSEVPGYVYFEGSSGEQDYYVNMIERDLNRGSGNVEAHLMWAQGGEEWSIGGTCKFK